LPSEPKIFHGRESELAEILQVFAQQTPRVAILGPGGMGKTSLARAVLHHPKITARYEKNRLFIPCDTVATTVELGGLIGSHIGLKPGTDLKLVISHFSGDPPSLLILDNLETLWELTESRRDIENLLGLLTDIHHLALIITLRGAERPLNVRWTHPFLAPLKPLKHDAAQQTFFDIADDVHNHKEADKILLLTSNIPLVIDLVAHLVNYEGASNVLSRWETEGTSLLSDGYDRRSNLDLSISLSISCSRIRSLPHARDLLSLLSLLPDGLSDPELLKSNLPIDNILACKAALLRTSLAYVDDQGRVKSLVPIREYMNKFHTPLPHLIYPLLQYFKELLGLYKEHHGTLLSSKLGARITPNLANIQNILLRNLHQNSPDLITTIYCICDLDVYCFNSGHGGTPLMKQIPNALPQPVNYRLEFCFITQVVALWHHHQISNPEALIQKALEYISHFDDPILECEFLMMNVF
ncbi:hypothetical protein DFH09DRAFT_941511, partial [Mycena vulgaris]